MSEGTVPTRRIGTRAVVRQENSAMVESEATSTTTTETTSETTSSQTVPPSDSPKLDIKVVPKEEPMPEPVETPPMPVTTAATLTLVTTVPVSTPTITTPVTSPTITALQVKDALLLQRLGPSPFTGRKRKANFSNEETETLVRYVVKHFSALYGSEALRTESTRRNQRRSQLWNQIQKHVNDLGYTPRSIDDLKHKWRDLRLEVKRKITHRRTANKVPTAPGVSPIIDTKLTPLEEQVASTIGHHCSLDGEQEGLYIEPGVPRQSIFFNCRGSPGAPMPELNAGTGSPRPNAEISLLSPLISTSPAQLSFVLSEDGDNEEQDMDVTPAVPQTLLPTVAPSLAIKPFSETWSAVKDLGALVTTPNLLPLQQTIVAAAPQILTVKQEVLTTQAVAIPARCESQSSVVSSPEGSVSNATAKWNGDDSAAAAAHGTTEMVKLKVEEEDEDEEEEEGDSQDAGKNSPLPDSPDEWEGQSASPQPSDNAVEDSLPSTTSQDGDPPSGTDLPTNGDCSCETGDSKDEVKAKMQRLLELEERWDRMYDQELGIWEEERARQQQQHAQDRELQQQLLGVLTDIRDELRQLRQERAAARLNQSAANGSIPPTKVEEPESPKAAPETPKAAAAAAADQRTPPTTTGRRRGRPRLVRPTPEPARPIRAAPGTSSKS